MNKRKIFLSILLSLTILALTSCDGIFGGGNTPGGEEPGNGNSNTAKIPYNRIVYVDEDFDFTDLRAGVFDLTGVIAQTLDTEPERDGEIAIGDTNRTITAAAKAALASELEKSNVYDTGYIIYKQGNNIAVYWEIPEMAQLAVADFISVCVEQKALVIDDGIVKCQYYVKQSYEQEKYWLALEAVTSNEVVTALKKLYNYYDGARIVDFFANLWDGNVGGFYYAISARDNVGYAPDLESTDQVIQGLSRNGAFDDINAAFPAEIKAKIVAFAKSTQSRTDGYFYHPQWPQNREELNTDRYGRDMGRATSLIGYFTIDTDGDGIEEKQYPDWCAPNGVKCEQHDGTSEKCKFPIAQAVDYYTDSMHGNVTGALSTKISCAVSKMAKSSVTATASVNSHPDYSSPEAFSKWLEAYNSTVKENSGKAHNLSALYSEIASYGYQDIVLDHLDRIQEEVFKEQIENGETPTGVWQRNVDYKAVWGIIKFTTFHNAGNRGRKIDIKYVPYMIDTCIQVIAMAPDGDYASNDLWNQWAAIEEIYENVERYYGKEEVNKIREKLRENVSSLIDNSLKKIEDFKRSDGSFSLKSDGTSPETMYGTPISLGMVEGNVNSSNIICSMYRSIFSVLGCTQVPLFSKADGERFIETVTTLGPVEKDKIKSETLDFEDGEVPNSVSTKNFNEVSVTEDPTNPSNTVLYAESSANAANGHSLFFSTVSSGGSCYIFEAKMLVTKDSGSSNIIQLKLGDNNKTFAYVLILRKSGDTIAINEAVSTAGDGVTKTVANVAAGEWFKVRIEYYPSGEDTNSLETPVVKVWVNGEMVHTSSNYFGSQNGTPPQNLYTTATFYFLKTPEVKLYLDDCYFSKETKVFDEESSDTSDMRDN